MWPPCKDDRRASREKRCSRDRRMVRGINTSDGRPERLATSSNRPDISSPSSSNTPLCFPADEGGSIVSSINSDVEQNTQEKSQWEMDVYTRGRREDSRENRRSATHTIINNRLVSLCVCVCVWLVFFISFDGISNVYLEKLTLNFSGDIMWGHNDAVRITNVVHILKFTQIHRQQTDSKGYQSFPAAYTPFFFLFHIFLILILFVRKRLCVDARNMVMFDICNIIQIYPQLDVICLDWLAVTAQSRRAYILHRPESYTFNFTLSSQSWFFHHFGRRYKKLGIFHLILYSPADLTII